MPGDWVTAANFKQTRMVMRIGVVGLGAMGKAVANNLVGAGYSTIVWNRSPQPRSELVARGAIAASDIREAFRCDVVLSLLLDDAAIQAVLLDSGAITAAPAGTVHVCMSSISTSMAGALVRAHEQQGSGFVAGPMFGRPEAAAAAKLEIAIAGASILLDKVEPVLDGLGRTWRMGDDPQFGYLTKIAGNFMIACAVQAMAESAALVSSRGGDPESFLTLMSETLFPAPIYRTYSPAVACGVSPGTPVGPRVALKGVARTLGEAEVAGIRMLSAEIMRDRLQEADRLGLSEEDWSVALAKVVRASGPAPTAVRPLHGGQVS